METDNCNVNTMEDTIKAKQVQIVLIDESDNEPVGPNGGNPKDGDGDQVNKTDNAQAVLEMNEGQEIKIEQFEVVLVEESDHHVNAGNVGGNTGEGGESSSSSLLTATPKGVRENGPPPFLKKIYEIVEDPKTNPIISWSVRGDSFIIWDTFKLCTQIFPKYFRHANLSSFIYQLNNYGFRKISWERSEYYHEYFKAREPELLKKIKRRHHQFTASNSAPSDKSASKSDLIYLRKEQKKLEQLVKKLEQKQRNMDKNLAAFKARTESCVTKQKDTINLLANTFTPSFLLELKEKMKEPNKDDQESSKRQKLDNVQLNGSSSNVQDPLNSEKYAIMWEKQLDCETKEDVKDEEMANNDEMNKIVLDLEDLIGQPTDWAYIRELMLETGCSTNP